MSEVKTIPAKEMDLDAVVEKAVDRHGAGRDALIPILSEVNRIFGYIPTEALGKIRRLINTPEEGLFLSDSQLYAIASFYQMFSLRPVGRHMVRFCASAPCHVTGALQVIDAIQEQLGIQIGETSVDRQWSLLETSCLGICSVGPVFLVDDDLYGNVTAEKVPGILSRYR